MTATMTMVLAGCISVEPPGAEETPDESAPTTPIDLDCPGHGETPSAGAQQTGVSNSPGAFSYGGQTTAKSGTEVYLWQNPSSGAWVQWGGQSAVGSLTVVLEDKCGNELYRDELGGMQQGGSQEATSRGAPGEWVIKLEFVGFTGQMGLSITSG